jgi:hypothetical protein
MAAVPIGTKGESVDGPEEAFARVMNLMQELEKLLLAIKEAAIPVLISRGEPTAAAQRARSFLRLADRMLDDMNELLRSV